MKRNHCLCSFCICISILLSSCAEMQVKRDAIHAEQSSAYRSAIATAGDFDAAALCGTAALSKARVELEFAPGTKPYRLPSGLNAAAYCMPIPQGTQEMRISSNGGVGPSFHQITSIHPSVLLLGEDYRIVFDVRSPSYIPDSNGLASIGVKGVLTLGEAQPDARYAVVYIDPDSLNEKINVIAGRQLIPVPFGPYGKVKIHFAD